MSSDALTLDRDQPLIVRLLHQYGHLSDAQVAELRLPRTGDQTPEEVLIASGVADEADVAAAHARNLGLPWMAVEAEDGVSVDRSAARVSFTDTRGDVHEAGSVRQLAEHCGDLARRVSETVCRRHGLIPLGEDDGCIDVACVNPSRYAGVEAVRMRTGSVVRPVAATLTLFGALIETVFGERDMVQEIADEGGAAGEEDVAEDEPDNVVDLGRPIPQDKDSRVVRIVNIILGRAIEFGASDIHLEPYENDVRVRYRIDGKLIETTPPPKPLFVPTVSRLKILSKMDIAEKRVPQDGAIALKKGDIRTDLRVSTVPTVYGEKMVIRILDKSGIPKHLTDLGFTEDQAGAFVEAAQTPHGLMFVTGPTGSGKSTTLYCCLNLINDPDVNIVTVEDPVEYKFRGLNQVHVRANVGLTFASALRAFLRQDPDKIMVGEVRDVETAQICLRAALTGHLVLSTLHTNSALQVINRLTDMGIEPFLLGPALRLLQAQRLTRRLCVECKEPYELPADVAERYALEPGLTLYRPGRAECGRCQGNRYKGRVGLYEVIPIGETLRDLISQGASEAVLQQAARKEGIAFLDDSARTALIDGRTSLDEVSEYIEVNL